MAIFNKVGELLKKYVFSDSINIYRYFLLSVLLSLLISLIITLFEFNFKNFIILSLKLLLVLCTIFFTIVEIAQRL